MTEKEKKLQQQTSPETEAAKVPSVTPGISQPTQAQDNNYNQALNTLKTTQASMPTYAGTYDAQLNDIYGQIVNRDKFKYDVNADALYDQYKNQYINLGKMAMKDTMGQAAALTGGYGSSYGQAVGQQQYDAYLQQINEALPSFYGMALDQYNAEGNRLADMYAMTGDLAADEYGKYQDALKQYWQNRDYNYGNLMSLINSTGYKPTADEIAAAGMTQEQVDTLLKAWQVQNPDFGYKIGTLTPEEYKEITGVWPAGYGDGGGGGGGDGYSEGYNNGGLTPAQIVELQHATSLQARQAGLVLRRHTTGMWAARQVAITLASL